MHTRDHALLLTVIALTLRPGEVCEYCPRIENLRLPAGESNFTNGIPNYLILGLYDFKWRSAEAVKNGPYEMLLHRNFLNAKYCPVLWLLRWISISGITQGPLFPMLASNHAVVECDKVVKMHRKKGPEAQYYVKGTHGTAKPVLANMTQSMLHTINVNIFERAGYFGICNRSIRKTSAKWMAQCGAPEWQIKNAGRWKSNTFQKYLDEGFFDTGLAPHEMPIRKLWVWRRNTMATALHSELTQSGGRGRR